jgi:ribosome-binding protein aMBF1 (putative translation factor)
MPSSGELVRATGLCSLCDYKFVEEVVARYPARSMPGGWAYIQIRHLDADEIKALRVVLPKPVRRPAAGSVGDGRLDPVTQFAVNVRHRRKALGITQETAADRAQMDMSYWSRIERGIIDPGLRMVVRIATALETTSAELLDVAPEGSACASRRGRPLQA